MSSALLERVFDLFVQGEQTIERSAGGLGLGLAIVRNIVMLHGGTISATSEGAGKGSELIVRLPRSRAVDDSPTSVPPPAQRTFADGRRILIVDDNADAAEMLSAALLSGGYATAIANDGAGALALALEFRPHAILLDIGLPVVDGHEVARTLVAQLPTQKPMLIALTGYGTSADRERSRAAGFDFHLVKPVELAQLEELLSTVPGDAVNHND